VKIILNVYELLINRSFFSLRNLKTITQRNHIVSSSYLDIMGVQIEKIIDDDLVYTHAG
jgi:hypothetical protein